MSIIEVIILGIVEGFTEFLPISSTGHMILTSFALGIEKTDSLILFEIVTQLGATMAIVALFSRRLIQESETLKCVMIAFIPTGIIGLIAYKYIVAMFAIPMVSIVSLIVGGVLLIAFDLWKRKTEKSAPDTCLKMTWKKALIIGTLQTLAFIPGTSRSAATILAGMSVGLSRRDAAEFSFLLAIPTMFAASVWSIIQFEGEYSYDLFGAILLGSIISFVVAYWSVKLFMHFIDNFGLSFFGVYRILFACIFYYVFIY